MKSIALMSQKGGAGKTTIAIHLAIAAYRRGHRVVVLDTDPQQSAVVWASARTKCGMHEPGEPEVIAVKALHLATALGKLSDAPEPPDLVLVDTAPHAGPDAVDVARVVDRVVIPVRPGLLDLAAARDTISIVRDAKVNSLLVLSACPSRAPEITLAREHLALTGLPVAQTVVTERRVFSRALQTGRGVHEFEAGKGTDEIEFLLGEVLA